MRVEPFISGRLAYRLMATVDADLHAACRRVRQRVEPLCIAQHIGSEVQGVARLAILPSTSASRHNTPWMNGRLCWLCPT